MSFLRCCIADIVSSARRTRRDGFAIMVGCEEISSEMDYVGVKDRSTDAREQASAPHAQDLARREFAGDRRAAGARRNRISLARTINERV